LLSEGDEILSKKDAEAGALLKDIWSDTLESTELLLQIGKTEELFASLFSLVIKMKEYDTWYRQKEAGETISELMTKLNSLWNITLGKTDEELCISGPAGFREQLKNMLNEFATEVSTSASFKWQLD